MSATWLMSKRFELARITIEFRTPFIVGTGGGDDSVDSLCVTDANGLPAIPGTSLAGVLRHSIGAGDPDSDACRALFGFQQNDRGQASRLHVSWAQAHDSNDRSIPFRGVVVEKDPVLGFLSEGVRRDHVRIDSRGVVDGRGKFDELLVPAGARFTFELRLDLDGLDDGVPRLNDIVAKLKSSDLRLGGRSRRGLGDFTVRRVLYRTFDLGEEVDWVALSRLPNALDISVPGDLMTSIEVEPAPAADTVTATLTLKAEDFFLFGGDPDVGEERRQGEKPRPDMNAFRERRILWKKGKGVVTDKPEYVLVASGIKGALRHRTAFHSRRLAGRVLDWRQPLTEEAKAQAIAPPDVEPAIVELFGSTKRSDKEREGLEERPGRVLVTELRAKDLKTGRLQHVSLDRFTSGPIDSALFDEEPVWAPEREWKLDVHVVHAGGVPPENRQPLVSALEDLAAGRLAVGGGASRGHGYFRGELVWSDGGAWASKGGAS